MFPDAEKSYKSCYIPQSKIPWQEKMDQADRSELGVDEDLTELVGGPTMDEWTTKSERLKKLSPHTHAQLGDPSESSHEADTTIIKDHWGTDRLPMLIVPPKSDISTSWWDLVRFTEGAGGVPKPNADHALADVMLSINGSLIWTQDHLVTWVHAERFFFQELCYIPR